MENVACCPWCRNREAETLAILDFPDKYLDLIDPALNAAPRAWLECGSCGFIYSTPRLTLKEQEKLYSLFRNPDFRKERADEYFDRLTSLPEEASTAHWKAVFIHGELERESIENILDVGCGGGILLFRLRPFFSRARMTGLEPNAEYSEMVARRLGIRVAPDTSAPGIVEEAFDLVLCTNVLEHVTDTHAFFSMLGGAVRPGGFLFLEVPSPQCFGAIPLEKDAFLSPHLYFIPGRHMEELASGSGFELVRHALHARADGVNDNYIFRKTAKRSGG